MIKFKQVFPCLLWCYFSTCQ